MSGGRHGDVRDLVTIMLLVLTTACSGKGGQTGDAAITGGGGAGARDGGAAGVGGGSADALIVPANPLCPGQVPITASAAPLPDGVQILADAPGAWHMVVGGGYAYWQTETAILRVATTGGPVATVLDRATARNHLGWLAVDGATLYFSESGIYNPLGIAKMPGDGSAAPSTIVLGTGTFNGNSFGNLVVSGGYVYYYDNGYGTISRVPVAGGTPTVLVRDVSPTDQMTVANGFLYFIHPRSNSFDVHLLRVPITAQSPVDAGAPDPDAGPTPIGAQDLTATDNYNTYGVVADGTNLYWDEASRVKAIPLAGGAPVTLDEEPDHAGSFGLSDTTYIGSVAAGSGLIYWNGQLNCSDILRAKPDGTQKTAIVHAVATPYELKVDGDYVYFLTLRQLLRAPR